MLNSKWQDVSVFEFLVVIPHHEVYLKPCWIIKHICEPRSSNIKPIYIYNIHIRLWFRFPKLSEKHRFNFILVDVVKWSKYLSYNLEPLLPNYRKRHFCRNASCTEPKILSGNGSIPVGLYLLKTRYKVMASAKIFNTLS